MSRWAFPALVLLGACKPNYDDILALEGDAVRGQFIFEGNCASCHGVDGLGVTGPSLVERLPSLTSTEILMAIDEGPGDMPSFGGDFDDQEFSDVLTYVTLEFQ